MIITNRWTWKPCIKPGPKSLNITWSLILGLSFSAITARTTKSHVTLMVLHVRLNGTWRSPGARPYAFTTGSNGRTGPRGPNLRYRRRLTRWRRRLKVPAVYAPTLVKSKCCMGQSHSCNAPYIGQICRPLEVLKPKLSGPYLATRNPQGCSSLTLHNGSPLGGMYSYAGNMNRVWTFLLYHRN